jgi:MinD-like ATPase involved in chromosome partitioning or flagellar assembly
VSLDLKGFIPNDPNLRQATKQQQLVVNAQAGCPSSLAIRKLSEKVSGLGQIPELKGSIQFFWQQLSGVA